MAASLNCCGRHLKLQAAASISSINLQQQHAAAAARFRPQKPRPSKKKKGVTCHTCVTCHHHQTNKRRRRRPETAASSKRWGLATSPGLNICRRISVLHHLGIIDPFHVVVRSAPPALLHQSMQRGACCVRLQSVQCSIAAAIAAWGVGPHQGNAAADAKKQRRRRCSPIALASGCHSTHQV